MKIKKLIFILIASLVFLCLYFFQHRRAESATSLFPIQNYDQNISHWIQPIDPDYRQPLLTPALQKIRYREWYDRNYGAYSPWNKDYLARIYSLKTSENLGSIEQEIINFFSDENKLAQGIGYGSNYRPYPPLWIQGLQKKMNLKQLAAMEYDPIRRAIAITNITARLLPTQEVYFKYKLPVFDKLVVSIIWAGTPLYILAETLERDWSLVLTPNFIAWIKSTDLAHIDEQFINTWKQSAEESLIAITQTGIPISDVEDNLYRFSAYIGMAFPGAIKGDHIRILIPVSDEKGMARIYFASLTPQQATLMPLLATPENFANLISQQIGRPYGLGGVYFYNDCALELKNLYTPFAIWLPMRSVDQTNPEYYPIEAIDLSKDDLDERLAFLTKQGHKLMTIVYIGRHIFMFAGNYPDPHNPHRQIPLSYQNLWSLRTIIGKSVLLPISKKYPDAPHSPSFADKKYFKIAWLDIPPKTIKPPKINLRSLLGFEPNDYK